MVLFNDMEEYKKPTLFGRIMKWAFRLLIVLICLVLFFVGSLNLLQGTGEPQRNGLASALGELIGMNAEIGSLESFELFPQLIIDARNIRFEDKETSKPQILLSDFHFSGPGSIVFTKSNIFNEVMLDNLRFLNNGVTSLSVDRAEVKEEGDEHNYFHFSGNYGGEPFDVMMPLESWISKRNDKRYFKFQDGFPFVLKMADTDIQGAIVADSNNKMVLFAKGVFAAERTPCLLAKPETVWVGLNLNDFYMKTENGHTVTGQAQIRPEAGIVLLGDETTNISALNYNFEQIDEACKP